MYVGFLRLPATTRNMASHRQNSRVFEITTPTRLPLSKRLQNILDNIHNTDEVSVGELRSELRTGILLLMDGLEVVWAKIVRLEQMKIG